MQDRPEIKEPYHQSADDYYKDSLSIPSSFGHSVYQNFAGKWEGSTIGNYRLLDFVHPALSSSPEAEQLKKSIEQMDLVNDDPNMSTTKWLATGGAGLLGSALNPRTWPWLALGGAAGEGLAAGVGLAAKKILPEATTIFMRQPIAELLDSKLVNWLPKLIGKEGEEKTLSMGLVGERYAKSFGSFAGFSVPEDVNANYDNDTKHILWGGFFKSMGEQGAVGMAIDSIPFGYGILKAKLTRGLDLEAGTKITEAMIQKGIEKGHITKEDGKFIRDWHEAQDKPHETERMSDLQKQADAVNKRYGHNVNVSTHEVPFELFRAQTMEALQGAQADEIAANLPGELRTAFSDFLLNQDMDRFRDNPAELDGVRGAYDHVVEKLKHKIEKLKEADDIVDKHMTKGMADNMPYSQKGMLKYMRQSGFEASHMSQLPLTIPDNMVKRMKMQEKIDKLEAKQRKDRRRGLPENKQTAKRIKELKEKQPKILTPKEELQHLRSRLLTKDGLPKNWRNSHDYHRLRDLANVWHNAGTLLARVHLEAAYESQEAFTKLAGSALKASEAVIGNKADPKSLYNYLKRRLENPNEKIEPIEQVVEKGKEARKVPANDAEVINDMDRQIESVEAKEGKKLYEAVKEKYKEFKDNPGVFKNLISCVMGSMNNAESK